MNDTHSTHRRGRITARFAVVLCLLLAVGLVPASAFAAVRTSSDVEATYLNSATVTLSAPGATATYYQLDGADAVQGTSATTPVYGAHTLTFWSTDASGTENKVVAPFFVDDDVAPAVACDAVASYVVTATVKLTATDNFNGSNMDYLYYRVDGGAFSTVVAPASLAASKLLFARLSSIKVSGLKTASTVDPTQPVPSNHAVGPKTPAECVLCHDVVTPTPEPTTTPEPTGSVTPSGALVKSVVVTGIGTHTIEYWAQDIARNTSVHVTKTFVIAKRPTTLSIGSDHSSVKRYHSVVLSGIIKPDVANGTSIVVLAKKPGSSKYVKLSTRKTFSSHHWSYTYKLSSKGSYYFKAQYAGSATFGASTSKTIKVSSK